MRQRHAHVPHHRAVGQVALHARMAEPLGQRGQQAVGQHEVALAVLELDGVDLVGHRGRTHLVVLLPLHEVAAGNVLPGVHVEIEQDHVDPPHDGKPFAPGVVVFDLRRGWIEFQAKRFDEPPRKRDPVEIRIHRGERGPVAGCAVQLAAEAEGLQLPELPREARGKDRQFLAGRRRRCRLAVGLGGKRRVFPAFGQFQQLADHAFQQGPLQFFGVLPEDQAVSQIVDVLRRQGEVDPFRAGRKALAQVLHARHDVVGRPRLVAFDVFVLAVAERLPFLPDRRAFGGIEREEPARVRQRLQVGQFHEAAAAHQRLFAEQFGEIAELVGVAAVEGRDFLTHGRPPGLRRRCGADPPSSRRFRRGSGL